MVKPQIALVVGNGLSMSFGTHTGLSEQWNSQSPLGWHVDCPQNGGPFLNQLPLLKKLQNLTPDTSDFEIFKKLQDPNLCHQLKIHPRMGLVEARHFLTIAFSKLAHLQLERFDINWGWFKWMKQHRENLSCALSLNYDLLLEHCLENLGLPYTYYENNGNHQGIPVMKPHGSVNFEMVGIYAQPVYPLQGLFDGNDMPIVKIKHNRLLEPRLEPLCIAPNENNKYLGQQWLQPIKAEFIKKLKECTHCVFIGISYFECDRPELDEIVDSIPKKTQIIVANPKPPADFIKTLEGRPVVYWTSSNSPLCDKTNEPMLLKDAKTGELLPLCFCGSGISYQHCHSV